jgi:hypothetical protein
MTLALHVVALNRSPKRKKKKNAGGTVHIKQMGSNIEIIKGNPDPDAHYLMQLS